MQLERRVRPNQQKDGRLSVLQKDQGTLTRERSDSVNKLLLQELDLKFCYSVLKTLQLLFCFLDVVASLALTPVRQSVRGVVTVVLWWKSGLNL